MAMKIQRVSVEEAKKLAAAPVTTPEGYDPELVKELATMQIGEGFTVENEVGVTDRSTKRRLNGMAKIAGKELGWRINNGKLFAYISANAAVATANGVAPAPEQTRGKAS